ncbi:TetR/AcrR family transcriptional regulator C-terminal domain-containing protein [Streptomyces sp. NBC_00237]|uniref:TetR/AcrR family transcriptional regulator C-terminal domain-containing protein n=1 Tax=Streptomyces sp. NBC_00237 TaxID=2975687 RepID=UPI00224EB117|nr:TetR/AcrR family transcriptional regulator C-terminal domain-containing protein [Streptomyces sp. NBC_00237]MCX5203653.1 TetR/AcrR family transcriptional regulator C-terminal domain-containing protein [Streptomyces sp. NBC_00237]
MQPTPDSGKAGRPDTGRSGKVGRPPRLSLDAILATAGRILDTEGAGALSMRRLARELNSTPMSLYHHVQDKDDLLMLLLDAYAQDIPRPELPDEPREKLAVCARTFHDILADRPWIVEVLSSDAFASVSAMWMVEGVVDALIGCGLTPEDAAYAYRVIWTYTVGELTLLHRERPRERDRPTRLELTMASLDAEEFPRLAAFGGRWNEVTAADDHHRGLEAVIDGLLAQA